MQKKENFTKNAIKSVVLFVVFLLGTLSYNETLAKKSDLLSNTGVKSADVNDIPTYHGKIISPIPKPLQQLMLKYSWKPGCPVPISNLVLLELSYWGFDQHTHTGQLIVNKVVAQEVLDIFRDLYNQQFPIALMIPVENPMFQGNDDATMAANNSSAFNCRAITGKPGTYSNHSYGLAIDINTMINPYVKDSVVLPLSGYLNRSHPIPGMISRGDPVYKAFVSRGWAWGGDWDTRQDYQHFEKPNAISK